MVTVLDRLLEPLDRLLDPADAWLGDRPLDPGGLLRVGLGATIFLAGAHKLVAPGHWHAYLAPLFVSLWPTTLLPLDPVFVAFGLSEVLFGALLLADWHTPTVAALTALSLLGVVANLALAMAQGEPFADVLVRDLGLALFAVAVALDAARDGG